MRPGARPSSPRPRASWRVITIRACITISFACLLLLVLYPPLRHHGVARGLGIAVSGTVSIVSGLAYLRSQRGRS